MDKADEADEADKKDVTDEADKVDEVERSSNTIKFLPIQQSGMNTGKAEGVGR